MSLHQDAETILSLMDLTSLNDEDSALSIQTLLEGINSQYSLPAAICVYPKFVTQCAEVLAKQHWSNVDVATVTNFPEGDQSLESVLEQTRQAIEAGATEIDLVLPYKQLIAGDPDTPWQYVYSSKQICKGKARLKVIIESGELSSLELIAQATDIAILAGADFIKTSTGKVPVNATLEAAEVILNGIKASGQDVGIKVSGGIRTVQNAKQYLELANQVMGEKWVCREHVRFGASSLLNDVYHLLVNKEH